MSTPGPWPAGTKCVVVQVAGSQYDLPLGTIVTVGDDVCRTKDMTADEWGFPDMQWQETDKTAPGAGGILCTVYWPVPWLRKLDDDIDEVDRDISAIYRIGHKLTKKENA